MIEYRNTPDGLTPKHLDGFFVGWPVRPSADKHLAALRGSQRVIIAVDTATPATRQMEQGRKVFDNLNKFIRYVIIELVVYIITFLGASILNIAAGQPFSLSQILCINFLVNAPLGVALGMDKQAPGLITLNRGPAMRRS